VEQRAGQPDTGLGAEGTLTVGPIFGLISAFSWGAGDFCGGLVSRYASVLAAIIISQSLGLFLAIGLVIGSGEPAPSNVAMAWAAAAGASGVAGLGFFYFALSRGTMGVIAPLAALVGAGVPVLAAIGGGEAADTPRLAGIALALAAVVLISLPDRATSAHERRAWRIEVSELPLVLFSGLGFAGFFLCIDRASVSGSIWWPQMFVRLTGLALTLLFFALVLVARPRPSGWRQQARAMLGMNRLRAGGRSLGTIAPLLAMAGAGDLGGNTFFLFAEHADAFAVAVVLSSLYPVVTALLAASFLRERMRPVQLLGVALAAFAIALLH
jgi:drug/metabolite transporter (DMT)-like permease